MDAHANFARSTVATAPSPATSGTSLVVASGDGALFPTPPFNVTIWPAGAQPTAANAEIARVTGISTDTFTIARTTSTESPTFGPRTIVVGDQIAATVTKKTLTDIEAGGGGGALELIDLNSGSTTAAGSTGLGSINIPALTVDDELEIRVTLATSGATNLGAYLRESNITGAKLAEMAWASETGLSLQCNIRFCPVWGWVTSGLLRTQVNGFVHTGQDVAIGTLTQALWTGGTTGLEIRIAGTGGTTCHYTIGIWKRAGQ